MHTIDCHDEMREDRRIYDEGKHAVRKNKYISSSGVVAYMLKGSRECRSNVGYRCMLRSCE